MKPKTAFMQPMVEKKKRSTKSSSKKVREVDQPVRHSKSAKSMDTKPVSSTALEKKMKTRNPPPNRARRTRWICGRFCSARAAGGSMVVVSITQLCVCV